MESLDRVGQIEGNQLVAGGDSIQQQQQQQPFPVMLHTNAGIPSSTMSSSGGQAPGPSSDPRSTASTSGGRFPVFSPLPALCSVLVHQTSGLLQLQFSFSVVFPASIISELHVWFGVILTFVPHHKDAATTWCVISLMSPKLFFIRNGCSCLFCVQITEPLIFTCPFLVVELSVNHQL